MKNKIERIVDFFLVLKWIFLIISYYGSEKEN